MTSKMFPCLSVMAAIGVTVLGPAQSTEAGNLPARGGKSDFPISEPQCWSPNGGSVQNVCSTPKFWWMPLINVPAGWFWVSVTAQAANNTANVQCGTSGFNRDGTLYSSSGWLALPQFGVARDINMWTGIPAGGSGDVDCFVGPGGILRTLSW